MATKTFLAIKTLLFNYAKKLPLSLLLCPTSIIHVFPLLPRRWGSYQLVANLLRTCTAYLGPLVPVRSLPGRRSLRSTGTNRLLVPPVKRSTVGSRAFPVVGPKTWNALPEDVTSSQSEYTFRCQLKTWLFKKSFHDIII